MSTIVLAVPSPYSAIRRLTSRLGSYFQMIKSLQTGLLLVTAAAGYVSGCCLSITAASLSVLIGSLFLAVSGSTVLNMAYDRDIDACMSRTRSRPLPSGEVSPGEAWVLGSLLVVAGLFWSAWLDVRYAAVVLAGVMLDVLGYTVLLKRRTPYSILIGGLSGGMPVLAGRVLAVGQVDTIGLLMAFGVVLWIPTHIMTFSIRHQVDYARAGVPTFPSTYGVGVTRAAIAVSTILAVLTLCAAAWLIQISAGLLIALAAAGLILTVFVLAGLRRTGTRFNFLLYKGASVYLLATMLLIIVGGL